MRRSTHAADGLGWIGLAWYFSDGVSRAYDTGEGLHAVFGDDHERPFTDFEREVNGVLIVLNSSAEDGVHYIGVDRNGLEKKRSEFQRRRQNRMHAPYLP